MKSTVTLIRQQTATVEVEHPDNWTAAQVKSAASVRTADIVDGCCCEWEQRTTVGAVEIGGSVPPEMMSMGEDEEPTAPVQLTAEDLA